MQYCSQNLMMVKMLIFKSSFKTKTRFAAFSSLSARNYYACRFLDIQKTWRWKVAPRRKRPRPFHIMFSRLEKKPPFFSSSLTTTATWRKGCCPSVSTTPPTCWARAAEAGVAVPTGPPGGRASCVAWCARATPWSWTGSRCDDGQRVG